MTETTDSTPAAKGGLSAMLLPELKKVAGGLGIKATGMKKAELVSAIKAAQSGGGQPRAEKAERVEKAEKPARTEAPAVDAAEKPAKADKPEQSDAEAPAGDNARGNQNNRNQNNGQTNGQNPNQNANQGGNQAGQQNQAAGTDEEGGSRRNRRRRGRDRDRVAAPGGQGAGNQQPQQQGGGERRGNRNEPDLQILEDDVLAPCAGILDVLDSYAFVRTSGYMPGTDDVYVSLS
ncbi:MAG: transcription termination factor Rho, partial [Propionibacteriaceae bacterium]